MLDRIAARLLTRRPSPTVDLYFLNACGDLVGPAGPVRRVAPTVFESDAARLVIRHDTGAPPMASHRRLICLLDDAVFAGVTDPTLPADYRLKLATVECAAMRRLLPRADALVVSTDEVAGDLPAGLLRRGATVHRLDPAWDAPCAGLDHFDGPSGPLRALFLGAGTHRASLRFVRAALHPAMAREPRLEVMVSAGHGRRPLRGVAPGRIGTIQPTDWPGYRRALAKLRGHLALYPLPATVFARARSANKLIEHALAGAAPLYPEGWPPGERAAAAGAGLVLPPEPAVWTETILALAADPARARALAEAAQVLAAAIDGTSAQRALWPALLDPAASGAAGMPRPQVVEPVSL